MRHWSDALPLVAFWVGGMLMGYGWGKHSAERKAVFLLQQLEQGSVTVSWPTNLDFGTNVTIKHWKP